MENIVCNQEKNIFFCWGAPDIGTIVGQLEKITNIGHCICDLRIPSEYEADIEKNKKLTCIRSRHNYEKEWDNFCDIDATPALTEDLITKMLPYESMAIRMDMRRSELSNTDYEIGKIRYLSALRFWNYIFEKYNINRCVFCNVPHVQESYVAYALSRVKNIPIMMMCDTLFESYLAYGYSIETIGNNISKYYDQIKAQKEDIKLKKDLIEDFYQVYSQPLEEIKKRYNPGKDKSSEKMLDENSRKYDRYNNKAFVPIRKFKILIVSLLRYRGLKYYRKHSKSSSLAEYEQAMIFMTYYKVTQDEYNKLACEADFSKRYIYFALQVVPEMTTMPLAGSFVDQYTSIQLLARCAEKKGILLYVKEHIHQPFRDKRFYDIINKIKNVKLIKTTESTYDIIQHSVAVATQTGNCILEGIMMGKPAIVFGSGHIWKGMPGLHVISNENAGEIILDKILKKSYKIDRRQVKKYFKAIQECTINYNRGKYANGGENDISNLIDKLEIFLRIDFE